MWGLITLSMDFPIFSVALLLLLELITIVGSHWTQHHRYQQKKGRRLTHWNALIRRLRVENHSAGVPIRCGVRSLPDVNVPLWVNYFDIFSWGYCTRGKTLIWLKVTGELSSKRQKSTCDSQSSKSPSRPIRVCSALDIEAEGRPELSNKIQSTSLVLLVILAGVISRWKKRQTIPVGQQHEIELNVTVPYIFSARLYPYGESKGDSLLDPSSYSQPHVLKTELSYFEEKITALYVGNLTGWQ